MDLELSLQKYHDEHLGSGGRMPDERYASFDYCFNYFRFCARNWNRVHFTRLSGMRRIRFS